MDAHGHNAEMDFLVQLRLNYIAELPEKIDFLEALLLSSEKRPDSNGDIFNEVFRAVHSLKGSGGTYGLFIITKVCHKFEDYLRQIGGGKSIKSLRADAIPAALKFVDLLKEIAEIARQEHAQFDTVESHLKELVDEYEPNTHVRGIIVTNSRVVAGFCHQVSKSLDVHVKIIDNSYQALLQLLTTRYDLLITGTEMPLLTGKALVAALRLSESPNKYIPAILITSNDSLDKHTKRETDPDYIVHKDKDLVQHLGETMKKIIDKRAKEA